MKIDEITEEKILNIFKDIDENLMKIAEEKFNKSNFNASNINELKNFAGKGIIKIGLCKNERCINEVENYVSVLGIEEERKECIVCGNEGKITYVGKTY